MKYTGELITGDFEENTMTFKVEGEMTLQAGKYSIASIEEDPVKQWKAKAEKWDALGKAIESDYGYTDENGDFIEHAPENGGDLGTIGQKAAAAFGWL